MFPNFQSAKISKFLNNQLYKFLDMQYPQFTT